MPTDNIDDPAQLTGDNAHGHNWVGKVPASKVNNQPSSISDGNSINALINEIRLLREENLAFRESFEKAFKMNNPVESPPSLSTTFSDEDFEDYSLENSRDILNRQDVTESKFNEVRNNCIESVRLGDIQLAKGNASERVLFAWPTYSHYDPHAVLSRGHTNCGIVHLCRVAGHNTKSNERIVLGMIWKMRPYLKNGETILSFDSIAALGCFNSSHTEAFSYGLLEEFCSNKPYSSGRIMSISPLWDREVGLQWHLRYFGTSEIFSCGARNKGILCQREDSWFLDHRDEELFRLRERRLSLCVANEPGLPYMLVEAIDVHSPGYESWDELQLKPCLPWMGVAVFQMRICQYSQLWASGWSEVLDGLDNALRITVTNVLSKTSRRELMYDGDDLPRSENYFTILQLLRVFEDMINQSIQDLGQLTRGWSFKHELLSDAQQIEASKTITANWDRVTSVYRGHAQGLLDRINRKTEEVRSLRDGLFNAQSVRETKSGVRMNRYLMVFTIVTIVYLPPTFAATFFGMHLFDSLDGGSVIIEWTQTNFWKVFGGVTGGTYLLAALVLLSVRQRDTVISGLLYLRSLLFLSLREIKQQWNSRRPTATEDVENTSPEQQRRERRGAISY